jgi:hypothetical protein
MTPTANDGSDESGMLGMPGAVADLVSDPGRIAEVDLAILNR